MPCSRTRRSRNPSTTCSRRLFDQTVLWIVQAIEAAGIAIIVLGGVVATALFLRRLSRTDGFSDSYHRYRENLGRAILLGLEFLVAADIIGTVAVAPTFRNRGVLGLIVATARYSSGSPCRASWICSVSSLLKKVAAGFVSPECHPAAAVFE